MSPIVLVDARNVVRSRLPNLPEALFLELTRSWAEREDVRAFVVFEGRAPAPQADDRITVVGTGSGSADDWIAAEANRLADEDRLWLVTSDRGLRARVAPFVERTIGGGAFAGLLEALEPQGHPGESRGPPPRSHPRGR
ncbi:MAG: hypothetical protein ACRDNG_01190 [Gaiellaceae bacterium]